MHSSGIYCLDTKRIAHFSQCHHFPTMLLSTRSSLKHLNLLTTLEGAFAIRFRSSGQEVLVPPVQQPPPLQTLLTR